MLHLLCNIMKNFDMKENSTAIYDVLGISSATLCLIHCIVFPILSILPLGLFDNTIIDLTFAIFGILICLKILTSNAKHNVKVIFSISIFLLVLSSVLTLVFRIPNEIVIVGGFGMICGHLLNFRNSRSNR